MTTLATSQDNIDVFCIGMASIDILVRPVESVNLVDDTVKVEETRMANGGDALNVAINMARLNNRVAIGGQIGDDPFGQFLMTKMKSLGIDIQSLKVSRVASTGSAICLVRRNGDRNFLYCGGANELLTPADLDANVLTRSRIVFIGGTYMMPRFDGENAARFLQTAQKKGKITAMDVTWSAEGEWDKVNPCLPFLDYFMPSLNEAKMITGRDEPEAMADELLKRGVKNVVIKMGKNGALLKNAGDTFQCDPIPVAVQDTTGAGDSFNAGFLTGILKKWNLHKSVKFGCATSAFCIQEMGACAEGLNYEKVCAVAFNAL